MKDANRLPRENAKNTKESLFVLYAIYCGKKRPPPAMAFASVNSCVPRNVIGA